MEKEGEEQKQGKSKKIKQFLSNGIILDAKTAANLQLDTIKSHLRQSRVEGNGQKTDYLRHLLTNKINVASNEMLSKGGKFYNYRSYGYETIYQQNKIQLANAIQQFNQIQQSNSLVDQFNQDEENNNNNNNTTNTKQLQKFHRSLSPFNMQTDQDLFGKNKSHKYINTACLQFKKEKQEKVDQILENKVVHPNAKLSSAFTRMDRNRLNTLDNRHNNDTRTINYNPIFDQILPSPLPHKFLPLPSTQLNQLKINYKKRREDQTMQPDCIIRGNDCEFQIRNITCEMKKYSEKISQLLKKLEELEPKSNDQQRDKAYKDEVVDLIQEKKRLIGEEIIEIQKLFIKARTQYEDKIKDNLNEQEYNNFNKFPDKIKDHQININLETIPGRGALFPEQNVKDVNERLFNNYKEFKANDKDRFYFKMVKGRKQLFKVKEGPFLYDHSEQHDNTFYQKTANLVDMDKSSKQNNFYSKHDFHAQKNDNQDKSLIDWNKIVEGQQKLSTFLRPLKYTNMQMQTTRDKPNSNQIRTIKVNQNFYKVNQTPSSSPPPLFDVTKSKSHSPSKRNHLNSDNIITQAIFHI